MFAAYIFLAIPQISLHIPPLLVSFAMASRESSTNVNSDPAPPPPISGPSSGGLPSAATDQQPFPADAAGTLETGFPQSETSSRAIPPLPPPGPTPPPHPPRGISGLGTLETGLPQSETTSGAIPPLFPPRSTTPPHPSRGVPGHIQRSTGQNTNGTLTSFRGEYASASSQSPGIAYQPSPKFPQIQAPGQPPFILAQHPQSAPGDGVGGFTLFKDYAYRFDTIPSVRSDSDPPHYESEDVTGGVHEKVWPIYNKISEEHDKKMLKKWNSDLDVLLIFVSVTFGPNR